MNNQRLIDTEAKAIKIKIGEKSTLFGEPINLDDTNSLIVAAYYLMRYEESKFRAEMEEIGCLHN